jgi:iron(III) transport system ATP-binding protein
MKEGQIIQEGTPGKIYRQPANEYVAGLFGKYTSLSSALTKAFVAGAKAIKEKSFYRPEDFMITEKATGSLKGKVKTVTFFGGYYEVEISVLKSIITVKTTERNIRSGDKVYVSLT